METPQQPVQRLLTTQEAADYLHAAPKTLANWRCTGDGPLYIKRRGRIFYRQQALDAWLDQCTRASTSDPGNNRPNIVPFRREQHG